MSRSPSWACLSQPSSNTVLAPAANRRVSRRGGGGLAASLALLSLVVNVPAKASGTITVPASTATGIGLSAAANYQVTTDGQWKDYEDVVIVAALNGLAKAAANDGQALTTTTYASVASQLRTWLDQKAPQYPVFADEAACLRYAIDSMVPVVNASPASPLLPGVLNGLENLKLTRLEVPIDPTRQYPADLASSSISANAYQFIADRIQEGSDLAYNDSQFAAAVNPVLSDLLGIDSTASYSQIQSLFPSALPTPNSDGSFTVNNQSLLAQYQSAVGAAQNAVDVELTSLEATIGSGTTAQLRMSQLVSVRPLTQASPSLPGCTFQLLIQSNQCDPSAVLNSGTQGVVTGISKLIGLSDSATSAQISKVGSAVIDAGKAIGQIEAVGTGPGTVLGALGDTLGVIGPIGALAGAAVDIFSGLFGGSSSNPNAAVLAQIQKLSEQIARLQQDMDAQFMQVDATLQTILVTLNQDFALINYQLGVLSGDAQAIQVGLLDVQMQLNQLAVYSLAYAQTQEYETLVQYLNGCLNYRTVHNGADIGLSQYNTCENELFTWANNDVTDQLWAGVQQPDYSDANIYNIFLNSSVTGVCSGCASPFPTDVNYLAQFPAQNLGLPALSSVRLPNPEMWTLVARAYLELAQQWPQYTATINSVHLDDLIQVGTSLQQAIHNANSTGSGTGIVTNQPLFNAVVNKYNTAVTNLGSAINNDQTTYSGGLPTPNGISFNLFAGGANQTTSWSPSIGSIQFCDGSGNALPAPTNLLGLVPGLYAFSQGYLGSASGQLSICISQVQWVPTQTVSTPAQCHSDSSYLLYAFSGYDPFDGEGNWINVAQASCVPVLASGSVASGTAVWHFVPSDVQTLAQVNVSVDVRFNNTPLLTVTGTSTQTILESDSTFLFSNANGTFVPCYESTFAGCVAVTLGCLPVDSVWTCSYFDYQGNIINDLVAAFSGEMQSTQTNTDLPAAVASNWTSGLTLLSLINSLPQIVTHPQPALASSVAAAIDAVAASYQQGLYAKIASDFGAVTPVQTAGQLLSGTKLLSQAYASFGLPVSMQTNDTLQELLYGSGSILDLAAVQSDFLGFSSSSISNTMDNKITDETSRLNSLSTALEAAFTFALTQIQQSGTPDSLPQIDQTVNDLQAFEALKNASALSPCSYQVSAPSGNIVLAGGSIALTVNSLSGCILNPTSGSPWLTITTQSLGSGQFEITLNALPDANGARSGVVILGDQLFTVLQSTQPIPSKPGIWRPSAYNMVAEDVDGNIAWDSPPDQANFFGETGDIVIVGDWNGSGHDCMGIFRPSVAMFALDMNCNGQWDPGVDRFGFFGQNGDQPIIGDWTGDGKSKIGIYRPSTSLFALDINNNLSWDVGIDEAGLFGQPGDTPIVGDWNGNGMYKIGIFRHGFWALDSNGNLAWDPGTDASGTIGQTGDTPLLGDWNGDGRTKVGIYRSSSGLFAEDYNGNLVWDQGTDRAGILGPIGSIPVVGDWTGTGITRVGVVYGDSYWALDTNGNIVWDTGIHWGAFGAAGDTPVVGRW